MRAKAAAQSLFLPPYEEATRSATPQDCRSVSIYLHIKTISAFIYAYIHTYSIPYLSVANRIEYLAELEYFVQSLSNERSLGARTAPHSIAKACNIRMYVCMYVCVYISANVNK